MTYSPEPQSPARPAARPEQIHAAYIAGISPAVQAVILRLLTWLFAEQGGRAARAAQRTAAISALAMILICLPGSQQERKALLFTLAAKTQTQRRRLYAAYLTWRQRKCWMWGGGLMAPALMGARGRLTNVAAAARDGRSFDALIPN